MNILLFGPQGSGKGTQAKYLAERLKTPRLSIGQLYRQEIKRQTALGREAEKYVLQGALVPLKVTKELLRKELFKKKYRKGLILDGYPRNKQQFNFLKKILKIDYAVVINIPQRITIKRLSGRRICTSCGETYNVHLDGNGIKKLKCRCGGQLIRRKDDYPKAIKERLAIYHQETLPVIKMLEKDNKVIKVNGQGSIRWIFKRIVSGFKNKGITI